MEVELGAAPVLDRQLKTRAPRRAAVSRTLPAIVSDLVARRITPAEWNVASALHTARWAALTFPGMETLDVLIIWSARPPVRAAMSAEEAVASWVASAARQARAQEDSHTFGRAEAEELERYRSTLSRAVTALQKATDPSRFPKTGLAYLVDFARGGGAPSAPHAWLDDEKADEFYSGNRARVAELLQAAEQGCAAVETLLTALDTSSLPRRASPLRRVFIRELRGIWIMLTRREPGRGSSGPFVRFVEAAADYCNLPSQGIGKGVAEVARRDNWPGTRSAKSRRKG